MKLITRSILVAVLGAATLTSIAQDAGRPERREGGPRRGGSPVIAALDADKDGTISAPEIANAKVAILMLDKNNDGALTAEELHPARPDGAPAPDGARPPRDGAGPEGAGKRPVSPVMVALDKNDDGSLDATEIAGASAALATLDKNGDGKLTREELRPARPEGAPEGAPEGGRGRGGPGGADGKKGPRGQRPPAGE